MKKPLPGEPAPDFELPDQTGGTVRLSDFRGKTAVVLFFYPKDDTAGCTKEACTFRDRSGDFSAAGATILGISSDSPASHDRFAAKFRLPFPLLSDHGGKVRKRYGVSSTFGIIPGRATYVIDREGVLRHVFSSQFQPDRHAAEALGILNAL